MNKWSDHLCKSAITSHLIEDVNVELSGQALNDLPLQLGLKVENKDDLKSLKDCIAQLKPHLSKGLFIAIKEEFQEIKSDISWIGTKRGKYIATLNDWQQAFHKEFRSIEAFDDVLIGGHAHKMVVCVAGKIHTEEALDRLMNYVQSKNPPFKIMNALIYTY